MAHQDDNDSTRAERQARRAALAPGTQVGIDEAMVHRMVHSFYARIREDEMLGPIFNGAIQNRWDTHLANMVDFWSSVVLMTGRYSGRPMAAHLLLDAKRGEHGMPRLDQPHFDRWLELWRETAREELVPDHAEAIVAKAERIAESLKLALWFRLDRPRCAD